MNLAEAQTALSTCIREELRDHAFGDVEVFWGKEGNDYVAGGYFSSFEAKVWFHTAKGKNGATFKDDEARQLRYCGTEGVISRNDETGPEKFVEGQVAPGLTVGEVLKELTNGE